METIDIKEMLNYFKSKLSLIILVTLVVGIIGCLYGIFIQVPKYSSSTTIVLISEHSSDSSLTNNDLSLNQNLVSTYSEIIKSKRVLNQVCNNLSLDYKYEELYNNIKVTAVLDTQIIKIEVSDTDKDIAKDIANEIASVFSKEIPELYNISNVNVLDKAEAATKASNINVLKQSIIFLLAGLVLGSTIVFIIFYFDRTIKTVEQVESKIGLPILGTVQEFKKGKK